MRWFETQRRADGLEGDGGSPVQVGPQQLALADPVCQSGIELDLAVLAIGVMEADPKTAVARVGCEDQWRTASMSATRIARNAVAYWSTSMDRSTCCVTGGSIAPTGGIRDIV